MKAIAIAFAAMIVLASSAAAQQASLSTQSSYVGGPWQQNASVGIHPTASRVNFSSAALASGTASRGQPVALMAVGGAAIILGALTDNDVGGLLIIGGSVIGLYGLYLYLR